MEVDGEILSSEGSGIVVAETLTLEPTPRSLLTSLCLGIVGTEVPSLLLVKAGVEIGPLEEAISEEAVAEGAGSEEAGSEGAGSEEAGSEEAVSTARLRRFCFRVCAAVDSRPGSSTEDSVAFWAATSCCGQDSGACCKDFGAGCKVFCARRETFFMAVMMLRSWYGCTTPSPPFRSSTTSRCAALQTIMGASWAHSDNCIKYGNMVFWTACSWALAIGFDAGLELADAF